MKNLFVIICLFFSELAFAQMQDLRKLATGELVYSTILYDANGDLYGYFYLYKRDVDVTHKTMEYVLLDKNLNKVSNNIFVNNSYNENSFSGGKCHYLDCSLMGDNVILTNLYFYTPVVNSGYPTPLTTTLQIVSLKDTMVSKELKYQDGVFTELPDDLVKLKLENKKVETKYLVQSINNDSLSGFFISQNNMEGYNYKEKDFQFYNAKRELLWKYEYNPNGTFNDLTTCKVIHVKGNNIYLKQTHYIKNYPTDVKIVMLDLRTGEKKYETVVEDVNSQYNHTIKAKEIDGKLFITGNYSPYKNKYLFRLDKNLGYFKLVLSQNGEVISKQYSNWSDFSKFMKVSKNGLVDKEFQLNTKSFWIFKEGAISIIAEKYKPASNTLWFLLMPIIYMMTDHSHETSDMVLINFDESFQLKDIKTVFKERSSANNEDYLFSQYIQNEEGGTYFFKDSTKKPNDLRSEWVLGINTYLKGQFTQERIPLTSGRQYEIEPLPAKEGYIMLWESNEKDKYNQVRLEKLNF